MANFGTAPEVKTPEYLMSRIMAAQETIARLQRKIERDPGSVHVQVMAGKIAELDLAIQMWQQDLGEQ